MSLGILALLKIGNACNKGVNIQKKTSYHTTNVLNKFINVVKIRMILIGKLVCR